MIDFTHTSESSSPPSSDIEAERTIPVAARVRHPIIPSSDSATIDQIGESGPFHSTSSRSRAPVETVVHVIAINNSKDPRAHKASTLQFQQRQMTVKVYSDQYDGPDFDYGPGTRDSAVQRGPQADQASSSGDEDSDFAGTENEKLLEEIADMEKENVRMNSQIRRNQLKASSKVMRELKGDVGYEKDLGRELQRKRREQKAHNEEKEWQLAKSKDLVIAMPADCQARPKLHALRNADWDNEDTTDTTTTNYDDYEPKTMTKITTIITLKAGIEAGSARTGPYHRQLPVHLNLLTSTSLRSQH